MTGHHLAVGDHVRAAYKTGEYIGEVVELSGSAKVAVKILAVRTHPTQGDLHHPNDGGVAFFHQRRALAFQEIALMPLTTIKPFTGNVPAYQDSLKRAFEAQVQELSNLHEWSKRSLQELEQLQAEYFPE
ncbi:Kinase-associated lipoprotein B precursor [compost metagenome]